MVSLALPTAQMEALALLMAVMAAGSGSVEDASKNTRNHAVESFKVGVDHGDGDSGNVDSSGSVDDPFEATKPTQLKV